MGNFFFQILPPKIIVPTKSRPRFLESNNPIEDPNPSTHNPAFVRVELPRAPSLQLFAMSMDLKWLRYVEWPCGKAPLLVVRSGNELRNLERKIFKNSDSRHELRIV